ncbi:MAG: hypothetical protein IJY59_09340 [Bacteroidaceae bacterium]|nr:hypothetical protein [Bacteroidaceae bacterium]
MKNLIKHTTACLLMFVGIQANAQGLSSAAMEQLKMQRLWLNSQNAAGMVFDNATNFSNLNLNYNLQDGNFHRPQEGEKTTEVGVSSEGFMNLKNALVWGSFSFMQRNLTDAGYNASISDPFRGMPYYVIDEHQSDWRNQYYDLRFRASTPLLNDRWAIGIEGIYQASLAAKQRDPRVDTRFYTLKIVPGVTYQFNESNRLGLTFRYESIKEDSRMENANDDIDQTYYILYGLGTAVQGIGSGRTSNYYGDRFGGALQYNFLLPSWNILVEGSYDVRAENVEQSYTSPKKDAGVKDKTFQLSATAYQQGENYSHYLKAAYTDRHIDGIQYVSEYDNTESLDGWNVLYKSIRSTYDTQKAVFNYALIRNRGNEYNWKIEAGAEYWKQEDEYLLPNSIKNAENLLFSLGGKKNFVVGNKMNNRLLLDIHGAYNKNLSGEYQYGGSHADYISVTGLETADANYLNSDFYRIGASLTYSQLIKEGVKTNFFVKAAFDRVGTSDFEYDNRNHFSISAGCNF